MNKTMKILSIVLIAIMLIATASTVFASAPTDIINSLETKQTEAATDTTESTTKLTATAGKIMNLIRNIAVIAGVIILMIIGVKFMLGSTEEKAEYKKSLVPLVVGIVIVMAATTIASFLFGMF